MNKIYRMFFCTDTAFIALAVMIARAISSYRWIVKLIQSHNEQQEDAPCVV
jgi:hypothetical protein